MDALIRALTGAAWEARKAAAITSDRMEALRLVKLSDVLNAEARSLRSRVEVAA